MIPATAVTTNGDSIVLILDLLAIAKSHSSDRRNRDIAKGSWMNTLLRHRFPTALETNFREFVVKSWHRHFA
jgi:hypothetical protein